MFNIAYQVRLSHNIVMTYTFEHGRRVRPSIVDSIFFPGEKNDLKIAVKKNPGIKPAKTGAIAILSPAAWQHAGAYIDQHLPVQNRRIKMLLYSALFTGSIQRVYFSDSDSFSTPKEIEVARELVTSFQNAAPCSIWMTALTKSTA